MSTPPACRIFSSLGISTSAAPAISGVDSRKENRAAASRVILRHNPATIVMPERDTPGKSARACALRDQRVSQVHFLELAAQPAGRFHHNHQHRHADHRRRDRARISPGLLDEVLEEIAPTMAPGMVPTTSSQNRRRFVAMLVARGRWIAHSRNR